MPSDAQRWRFLADHKLTLRTYGQSLCDVLGVGPANLLEATRRGKTLNVCWIIPPEGESHRRDVLPSDERELFAKGYSRYRLECDPGEPSARTAFIYAKASLTNDDLWRGVLPGLFGDKSCATIRLYGPAGNQLLP